MTTDTDSSSLDLGRPRWPGRQGRLEVWYATFTDEDGTGYWLHCETVVPTGGDPPYAHGWAAVFPADGPPEQARFGPVPARPPDRGAWFDAAGVVLGPGRFSGSARELSWDLRFGDPGPPLHTFPAATWHRELLPASQIVPWPTARFQGPFTRGGAPRHIAGRGAVARIYGHGNAERWCWLHADLEEGAVLELVAATARRPGLRRLSPVPLLQLRRAGAPDWPRRQLLAAPLLRTRLSPWGFSVSGVVGRRRLRIEVALPPERCVSLGYTDPDGATATCVNSERADATVTLDRWGRGWSREAHWELRGTAHAEMGTRP